MYSKLDNYKRYYENGYWNNERALIIGKINLKFDPNDYPFKVKQVRGIEDLSDSIKSYREVKLQEIKKRTITPITNNFKSINGEIKFVL